MSPNTVGPHTAYEERRRRFAGEASELERRSRNLGNVRLGVFLLGAAAFLAPVFGAPATLSFQAAGGCFVVFIVLMVIHDRVERTKKRAQEGLRINEEGLARLARDWDGVPEPRWSAQEEPSFARDLDLFGHASLWKLLGTVSTPLGRNTLGSWLLEGAFGDEVKSRQSAVRELVPRLDFRQELQLRARTMEKLHPDCEPFLRWAEGERWLVHRPALIWYARLAPVVTLTLLGLALTGPLPHAFWMIMVLVNLGLAFAVGGKAHEIFNLISSQEGEFLGYSRALELLDSVPPPYSPQGDNDETLGSDSKRLAALHERLSSEGRQAHRQMERLHRLVTLSDVRFSGSLHMPLVGFLMWDFHVLDRMESWQQQSGRWARVWLEVLGEVEALAALAGLSFEEPDWCLPEVVTPESPEDHVFKAEGLGHPLLGGDVRVTNDVQLGPPGTFLLITGSNMSGKSTLIRSMGLNAVLAQAGGPVCAKRLTMPPVELGTSILIEDSLEDGVSFFMAELKRVKTIVDLSTASRKRGRTLFYLMDEILRGTNSFERQEAVRKVVIHLLKEGAIGAVSTHDLTLADIDELREACHPVHFRETVENTPGRPVMSFDYKLREGVATTRNALKLLELVGLGFE